MVKMSANWEVVGTWRTRTSPIVTLANEVQVDLHMLRPLMLNGVGGEIYGADVVAVDENALGERAVELRQELSKPGCLRYVVSDSMVLRLSTGAGDNRLPLGRSGD